MLRRCFTSLVIAASLVSVAAGAQKPAKPPLGPADIDNIAALLKMEDTRQLDLPALEKILKSAHPEVRRRAVQTLGRVLVPEGAPLLAALQSDPDPQIVGTVAFAYGQRKDAAAVLWLGAEMSNANTPVPVAQEAARSLGKIRTPEARALLARYLTDTAVSPAVSTVAGEALLSLGRFTGPANLAAITRWTKDDDAEVRWRATWALYRPRDMAAVPELLRLTHDSSGDVRFWAMRGLGLPAPPAPARGGRAGAPGSTPAAPPPAPATPPRPMTDADKASASARLREGLADSDRRVRTEALRALATFDDDASVDAVLKELDSKDSWMAASAVEATSRYTSRAASVVPRLSSVLNANAPTAVRITALAPLAALAPSQAMDLAVALLHDKSSTARQQAVQTLRRLGDEGRARLEAAAAADPKLAPLAAAPGPRQPPPPRPVRTDADYRRLVTDWIVPAYNGAAAPHVVLDTPRGAIDIELYPGDAPFGVEYLLDVVKTGAIVGSEFPRVVPNFVDQEAGIRADAPLRDEVNRRGLTRGNLSWASSGLDTGRPGYTLGITPQPHNEGDFTSLGGVVKGMDVVDRIQLGDAITGARVTGRGAGSK